MKYENAAITFIIVLLANIFLFWLARDAANVFFGSTGKLIFMAVVVVALLRFLLTSIRFQKKTSSLFYIGLLVITVILLLVQVISAQAVIPLVDWLFLFAVLIAIVLAITELAYHFLVLHKIIVKERAKRKAMQKDLSKQLALSEREKQALIAKERASKRAALSDLSRKITSSEKGKKKILAEQERLRSLNARYMAGLKKRQDTMKKLNKDAQEAKSEMRKAQRNVSGLKRQEELKKKYAKTLYHLRKRQKEDEELLVVSPDGGSVHDPGCIAVRNISKENRKLIKNWKTAKKEGYKGCGLCNPHKKDTPIVKKGRNYKFVGSKSSDKLHKATCKLVERIKPSERDLFTNYKAGLKKGYTACRVCNPGQ